MSYIINIDTATENAFVNIAKDGQLIQVFQNDDQKDHGAFLQPVITKLLQSAGIDFSNIAAIAVTAGPGSYTGLRVGMASAKGLSYALNKPLITISTLALWASSAIRQTEQPDKFVFCPMIDARRMEVFTAVYDHNLNNIIQPAALILNELSFAELLNKQPVIFIGNGIIKWGKICSHSNASFIQSFSIPAALSELSYSAFLNREFTDLAYSEPYYLKEFQGNIL
ncbi:MAG: tRNA (adenosine(37)-N6)-threonylcarbamoyltransferase complex dimerization subunit type 1 TsaB [Ferruginibacter sp.]